MPVDVPPRRPHAWPVTAWLFVVPGALIVPSFVHPAVAGVRIWLAVAAWGGAVVHLIASVRGRRDASIGRTLIDTTALVFAFVLFVFVLPAIGSLLH